MLGQLNAMSECVPSYAPSIAQKPRDEKEDLKTAIDYLYDFKRKLNELHPNVLYLMERMLKC